ncbi:MAG: bifunctional phosphoribosylaminoimidazolecarboxamide formyltransferase/IMP cyclohydrolase [Candidatus Omnitrophica bacterium]|nr:bifunctional phosphoribosylaminoimidazolecarboxamide formyltransferase/IMP cyclohydrolase [Candidatus Omnitrophota bacterium]
MLKVHRILISVSDKKGLIPFVKGLSELNVEIISTGGTAKLIREAGIAVQDVSEYTGFPEMLDGRVKTLHPKIHGGLLSLRDNADHMEQIKKHGIGLIDMVVVNLYPFEKVTQKKNVHLEEAIENIDIGGPSMLRSAAKNYRSVAVVCNPDHYTNVLDELKQNNGLLPDSILYKLAVEAFEHTSRYDDIIQKFLKSRLTGSDFDSLPAQYEQKFEKLQVLRYGENPHQKAALYKSGAEAYGLANIHQLHGKELSFNNLLDLNAAIEFVKDFKDPAAVIIKHNNPTGVAVDESLGAAYKQAWGCDPVSAFGGIIGLNQVVDEETAESISQSGFMECILAPKFSPKAKTILGVKKNLRLIEFDFKKIVKEPFDIKKVYGGLLLQEKDERVLRTEDLKIVTKKNPTPSQLEAMLFGWHVIKNVKSNAILLIKDKHTVGIGCGQTSRIESLQTAISKAGKKAKNSIMISDAFLPKTDNIEVAAKAGITAIIQTGGSIADKEVIAAADHHKVAMIFTSVRHFKH